MSLAADVHPTVRRAIRCGDEAIRDHDPDSAAAHYREALDLNPDNPDVLIGLEYADYLRSKRASRFDFGLSPNGAPQTQLKEENQRQIEMDFRSERPSRKASLLTVSSSTRHAAISIVPTAPKGTILISRKNYPETG
jgi:hypothetical protein